MESVVCKRYEFEDSKDTIFTMNKFREFYNFKRIHSGVKYKSSCKFLLNRGIDMKNLKLTNGKICPKIKGLSHLKKLNSKASNTVLNWFMIL